MAENQSRCTGNCMACTIYQRQYCASQLAYSNMKMLEQMQKTMVSMQEKIEALQNSEAMLIDPMEDAVDDAQHAAGITQSGDGVL